MCPTAPELCAKFCLETLGDTKGGFCFDGNGVCCCNQMFERFFFVIVLSQYVF